MSQNLQKLPNSFWSLLWKRSFSISRATKSGTETPGFMRRGVTPGVEFWLRSVRVSGTVLGRGRDFRWMTRKRRTVDFY